MMTGVREDEGNSNRAKSHGSGAGSGPNTSPVPQNAVEASVQFINAEVLDPPEQGTLSFVRPYAEQSLAMALEDARSFLQGAEQILLIALAKELAKLVGSPAAAPSPDMVESVADPAAAMRPSQVFDGANTEPASALHSDAFLSGHQPVYGKTSPHAHAGTHAHDRGLKAIESFMLSLASFHSSVADTTLKFRVER